MKGKLIIISAPSGAGKTTIVRHLLAQNLPLSFSISATSRPKREQEQDKKDYYFLSADEFRERAENGDFLEWEEVYHNQFYGTLKSEIDRIWATGHHVVFDIDVLGGVNLKKQFQEQALSIFIKPPSHECLVERLKGRGTESAESLQKRVAKAEFELGYESQFDKVVVNDILEEAQAEVIDLVQQFISQA